MNAIWIIILLIDAFDFLGIDLPRFIRYRINKARYDRGAEVTDWGDQKCVDNIIKRRLLCLLYKLDVVDKERTINYITHKLPY